MLGCKQQQSNGRTPHESMSVSLKSMSSMQNAQSCLFLELQSVAPKLSYHPYVHKAHSLGIFTALHAKLACMSCLCLSFAKQYQYELTSRF